MKMLQIDYFLAVAEKLSFTSAAKSLYISQPALSKQIALLEEELGTPLLIRNRRRLELTAAGESFMADLTKIRRSLEQAKRRAVEIGKKERRTIRVGCFDGVVIDDFLPEFYRHIHKTDPAVQILLSTTTFEENRRALESDKIDLLFTLDVEFDGSPEFNVLNISKRRSAIIFAREMFSKAHEQITAADFTELPLLTPPRQASKLSQNSIKHLELLGIDHPHILEMDNIATLRACLEMGQGYAVLTEDAVRNNPRLACFPLPDDADTWVIAAWKKDRHTIEKLMEHFYNQ